MIDSLLGGGKRPLRIRALERHRFASFLRWRPGGGLRFLKWVLKTRILPLFIYLSALFILTRQALIYRSPTVLFFF